MLNKLTREQRLVIEFKNYNKHARSFGFTEKTFEQFKSLKRGQYKPTIKNCKSSLEAITAIRKSPSVPSGAGVSYCPINTDGKFYTGNRLLGIATLHKSCLQPVFSRKDAEDIAKMRRS